MGTYRVLVVSDGDRFNFSPQSGFEDFSINTFVTALSGATTHSITVDTAHRKGTTVPGRGESIHGDFKFNQTGFDLEVYDAIFLFGDEGYNGGAQPTVTTALDPDELIVLTRYMENGGGVFAIGDHDGIGAVMCGDLPRVRTMRKWFEWDHPRPGFVANWSSGATTMTPTDPPQPRFDTLQHDSSSSTVYSFFDQSDPTPQTITFPSGPLHPVLQGSAGPIDRFPDHMHEGEATDFAAVGSPSPFVPPAHLTITGSSLPSMTIVEFPSVGAATPEVPKVIAFGTEIAGHLTTYDSTSYIATDGKTLGVLAAYDGHRVGVGRILTGSTFHHYLDINLIGDPGSQSMGATGSTLGLPGPVLDGMRELFVNMVVWLARVRKTCTLLVNDSTFGRDQLQSLGLPHTFPSAFWVALDGFLPHELGLDAPSDYGSPPNRPHVAFTIDPPANTGTIPADLMAQLTVDNLHPPVLADSSSPDPNTPQRFLFPFDVTFTGVDGFQMDNELLTLNATISVGGKTFTASAKIDLTSHANPFLTNADAGNGYTAWLSTDLRVFTVDEDESFFGARVNDYTDGPNGYITQLIARLTQHGGAYGGQSFDHDLSEQEDATRSRLEYLPVNPRTSKRAYNFAVCRVRLRGQLQVATNCRVFFRAFQAQTTVTTFDTSTTYRETPVVPSYGDRVPLLGVQTDPFGAPEYVTIPFFAVPRVNAAGPADLTTQPADVPNRQTITPIPGAEVDTYYGCWLDLNQTTPLFPLVVPPTDFDNQHGSFGTASYPLHSINDAINRAPHQCLVAEIAFDDVPIPPTADTGTSDKLAQRNLAWIDGPNPGVLDSRRMPHPFQLRATAPRSANLDELLVTWGNVPRGSEAAIYLPSLSAPAIVALADELYASHRLRVEDAHTIRVAAEGATFVPIPRGTGLAAGLVTVDLPPGIKRGERFTFTVRQLTDALAVTRGAELGLKALKAPSLSKGRVRLGATPKHTARKGQHGPIAWRRVAGAFQVNLAIATKAELLEPEERRLALFESIARVVPKKSRWHPVLGRYVEQLAGRVAGFGGDPRKIPPSPIGHLPGDPGQGHGHRHHGHHGHHGHEHAIEVRGKVEAILYDRFGDFEGFVVETRSGERHRFASREGRVLELVRRAWAERLLVTVESEPHAPRSIHAIAIGGSPAGHA